MGLFVLPILLNMTIFDFDRKVVEDKDGKKEGKEAVTNLEEETSKKREQCKKKRDAERVRALLLAAVSRLFASSSASIPLPGLPAVIPRSSATAPRLFAAMPRLFAFASMSISVPGLSAPMSAAVPVPGLSAVVFELSAILLKSSVAMPGLSPPASASVFVPGLSVAMFGLFVAIPGSSIVMPRLFVAMPELSTAMLGSSLPKILTPNLAAKRQKVDDTISRWSERSKKASSEELCSRKIKKAALEEVFLPRAPLFSLFFLSNSIGKRKFDKIFINTRPLANNHTEKKVDLSFTMCKYSSAIKLNMP